MIEYVKLSKLVNRIKVGFVGSINKFYTTESEGIPLLRTTDITSNGLNFKEIKFVTKDFHNKNKKSQIKHGDLIVARHGDNGKVNIYQENFECQVLNAVIIEPNKIILDSDSLKYILESPFVRQQIKGSIKGSVQGVINTAHISDLLIPYSENLNYSNQYRILRLIDKKIELNNHINAQLEQMAKTLYDYWFVQFDFPNAEGKPYKSSGGEMLYSEVLKREIPKGWEVSVFNDWIDRTKTGDWGKEDPEGNYTERVYCVRGADINGLNGKGEVKAPVRFILKNNLSKTLQPNDFIVEISGGSPVQSTGRIALLTAESFQRFDAPVICSNFCKAVSLKEENYAFNFKQEWQRLYDAEVFFGYEGKTSGIKNFLFDSFMDSYHIVKPPKELVKNYYEQSKVLEKKKQTNLQQNHQLAQLRDWLLPMLMNGQITVGEAEEMGEELGKVAEEKSKYQRMDKDISEFFGA